MKTRSNPTYNHSSEKEYNDFLDRYEARLSNNPTQEKLDTAYNRNHLVRGTTLNRGDRIIANNKIEIIKRIDKIFNS